MLCKASRYQCCWCFPSRGVSIYSVGEFCHSDVIYFAHALVIDRTSPIHVRILTQKSEEATASFALCYTLLLYPPILLLLIILQPVLTSLGVSKYFCRSIDLGLRLEQSGWTMSTALVQNQD